MEDFRGRVSDDRAVLELFQKALNELDHVMEGACARARVCVCMYLKGRNQLDSITESSSWKSLAKKLTAAFCSG